MDTECEWQYEPDHLDYELEGFPCIIHRNGLGALCGYVGVPKGHPAYEKHYGDLAIDCHGGLTYAERCQGDICHPGADDRWWIGFDCNHCGDFAPYMEENLRKLTVFLDYGTSGRKYRNIDYVKNEIKEIVRQLKEMT